MRPPKIILTKHSKIRAIERLGIKNEQDLKRWIRKAFKNADKIYRPLKTDPDYVPNVYWLFYEGYRIIYTTRYEILTIYPQKQSHSDTFLNSKYFYNSKYKRRLP